MNAIHYIGLDVHKKTISYCIKTAAGQIVKEGTLAAERSVLRSWAGSLQQPWHGAMEATIFSAWIYDTLKPYAERLEMGHPAKMKAITAGKKKSDTIDARTIADLVRCNLLPGCYVFSPDLRDLRRLMRYRHMMVQQSVRMHNKTAGLLMESGVSFHKTKLQGKKYFADLIKSLEEVPESVKDLLRMSRGTKDMFEGVQNQLLRKTAGRRSLKAARGAFEQHRRCGRDHRSDLGAGGRRPASFCLYRRCGELLRFDGSASLLCGQAAAGTDIQAAQRLAADRADRSGQAGAALESAAGAAVRSATRARTCQSRHLAGGAQASRLSAGRGQERPAFSGAYTAAKNHPNEEKSQKTSCLGGLAAGSRLSWVCSVSDPPAGPHVCRDCARELTLPIHPIVCFEVGWFTLTQSSWTRLRLRSRKWMSGHAATALAMRTIEDSSEPNPVNRSGKAIPPSQGKSPFSLDCYLGLPRLPKTGPADVRIAGRIALT